MQKTKLVNRRSLCAVILGITATSFATSHAALAQSVCFPTPVALPGLSGPPDWTAPGTVRTELNEPRWAAAPQTGFVSDLTGTEGLFRIMVDAAHTELSVSFQAPTDPNTASAADEVVFGFTTDGMTGNLAKGVKISLPATGTDPIPATIIQEYNYDVTQPTHWTSSLATPAWLREPAGWIADPTAAWGISFKVDLAASGLSTSAPFRIILAMHKRDEADVTPPFAAVDLWTPHPGFNPLLAGTLFIENPANWEPAAAIDAACIGGITINGSQIGTRNAVASEVNTTVGATNTFFATPTFPGGTFAGQIHGKFHMANWGSIAASNAPWTVIPNGSAVPNGGGSLPDGTLEFSCPVNTAGNTCGLPTPAVTHQCMYVELKPAPSQNPVFTKAAAYRNMTFKPLSKFSAPAEISVKGLKKFFGNDNPRDVYLYVYAKNMLPHRNEPLWLQTDKMAATRRFFERSPVTVRRDNKQGAATNAQGKPRPMPLPDTGVRDLDLNPLQAMATAWPTYDVHVYYDTGKIIKIDKVDTAQLAPMYPFTYFYSHEGPLYGFSHALKGIEGTELTELRPNVYLVKIPSEGIAKVSTQAEAHEAPRSPIEPPVCPPVPPPPARGMCNCSVPGAGTPGSRLRWALLGAPLLASVVRRRRRRH